MADWSPAQRNTVIACFLSWMLDAFDFFVLVFILSDIADSFGESVEAVSLAIMLTLAVRPIGALLFGRAAEKYGRKPMLIINIVMFSLFELASGLVPGLISLLVVRVLYGIAMGGIWGIASSLAMETIPQRSRGFVSGLFQAGYPAGYLVASIVYGALFAFIGWRGLFMLGVLPMLLAVFVYLRVPESPVWLKAKKNHTANAPLWPLIVKHWHFVVYAVVLMAAFNFFSHGTQDIYPTFLKEQHGFGPHTVSFIAICYNIAAILGGLCFGSLSQRIGRRWAIALAAVLALPIIPLWAYSTTVLWITVGAFAMQFMVQGAWGVVPAYLNESSPAGSRAVLPGFVYQLGNFVAASNATLQAWIASTQQGNYSFALAIVAGVVAVVIACVALAGRETRDAQIESG